MLKSVEITRVRGHTVQVEGHCSRVTFQRALKLHFNLLLDIDTIFFQFFCATLLLFGVTDKKKKNQMSTKSCRGSVEISL